MKIIVIIAAVLAIAAFLAYWAVILTLIMLGIIFLFWVFVIAYCVGDLYLAELCAIPATLVSIYIYSKLEVYKS